MEVIRGPGPVLRRPRAGPLQARGLGGSARVAAAG